MNLAKLNTAGELTNAVRALRLQDAQRTVDTDAKPTTVKRRLSAAEISQVGASVSDLASSAPDAAISIGATAAEFVPPDHRGVALYDYIGCALFHARRHADALLVWHMATRAESADDIDKPIPSSSASSVSSSVSSSAVDMPLRPRVGRRNKPAVSTAAADDSKQVPIDDAKQADDRRKADINRRLSETHRSLTHIRDNMFHALGSIAIPPMVGTDLKTLQSIVGTVDFRTTDWTCSAVPAPYHIFNPCIIAHPDDPKRKFLVVLRAANYTMTDKHIYQFPFGHTGVDTMNFVVDIDTAWTGKQFGNKPMMIVPTVPMPFPNKGTKNGITGQEDLRMAYDPVGQQLFVTFTSLEATENHKPGICAGKLDYKKGRLSDVVRLFPSFEPREKELEKVEKNWIPFVFGGELYCIYSFWPVTVLKPDLTTGACQLVSLDACLEANRWRGSSTLFQLSDGLIDAVPGARQRTKAGDIWYLAVVHVSEFPRYTHQFIAVRLRPSSHSEFRPFSLQVLAVGSPFVFQQPHDVEFTCGLAITPDGSEIVVPHSRRDEFCFCSRFPAVPLLSAMAAVDSPDDFAF